MNNLNKLIDLSECLGELCQLKDDLEKIAYPMEDKKAKDQYTIGFNAGKRQLAFDLLNEYFPPEKD